MWHVLLKIFSSFSPTVFKHNNNTYYVTKRGRWHGEYKEIHVPFAILISPMPTPMLGEVVCIVIVR